MKITSLTSITVSLGLLSAHLLPAMNPSLEEGSKALGEALGIFGRDGASSKRIMAGSMEVEAGVREGDIINVASPNNILRLRGGGPKKIRQSQSKGGLKSTGENEDEFDPADVASEIVCDVIHTDIDIAEKIRSIPQKLQEAHSKAEKATKDSLSCWKEVITSLEKSKKYWEKAFEIQKIGIALPRSAVNYSLVASESEQAAEYSRKAAEAYAQAWEKDEEEDWELGNLWKEAGKSMQLSANCGVKAIEVQGLGRENKAQEYIETSKVFKQALEKFVEAVQLLQEEKKEENTTLLYQGLSLQSEAMSKKYRLQEQEAQEAGRRTLAVGYQEAVGISQREADAQKLAVERRVAGEKREGCDWSNQGNSLQLKADYQAKASEGEETGKRALAVGYQEAVKSFQEAADQYTEAALAKAAGGKDDYHLQKEAEATAKEADAIAKKADYQSKACEAQEAGKTVLAAGYQEVAVTYQRLADQNKEAALAIGAGCENNCDRLQQMLIATNDEVDAIVKKADYLVKASEAQEAGKTALAAAYQKAAETYQGAADSFKKAALAEATSNGAYDNCYSRDWLKFGYAIADEAAAIVESAETERPLKKGCFMEVLGIK